MAEFERILESLRKLFKDPNESTEDLSGTFSSLTDVNKVYQNFKAENDSEDRAMEQACASVLDGRYIVTKCYAALLSPVLNALMPMKSKLPQRVHPIVEEMAAYFKGMTHELGEVDKTVQQMKKKVRNVKNVTKIF